MHLLQLPPELIIRILLELDDADAILTCEKTCSAFRALVPSAILQYTVACSVSGVVDNPAFPGSAVERLAALRAREDAFAVTRYTWKREVQVPFPVAGLYELSGGLFWLGDSSRRSLRWFRLPTREDEHPEWQQLNVIPEGTSSTIIDFGLAVEEHDLVLVAKYSWSGTDTKSGFITLHPYCISTRRPHHLAKGAIEVASSNSGQPRVTIEIVGDVVVFICGYNLFVNPPPGGMEPDRVFVFEWKTGVLRKQIIGPWRSYSGLVLLTPDLILLPNSLDASLEVWDISTAETYTPILTLHFPPFHPSASIRYMTARAEPNPSVYHTQASASAFPFSPAPEDAITIFHITFVFAAPGQVPTTIPFLLFIHRRSILELVYQHASSPTTAGPHALPYSAWGPPACRWMAAHGVGLDWITTSAGQRCIVLGSSGNLRGQMVLFDFNSHPRHLRQRERITSETEPNGMGWRAMPMEENSARQIPLFRLPLASKLPCWMRPIRMHRLGKPAEGTAALQKYLKDPYTGASMDETRVIGLKRNAMRQISAVEVLFFG